MQSKTTYLITAFPGSEFRIPAHGVLVSLADLGLGDPTQPLIESPIALTAHPLLLPGEAYPEVLNRLVVARDAAIHHPEQRVICDMIDKKSLDPGDEIVLRFLNREVAWAQRHEKALLSDIHPSWHTIIDTLHDDPHLSRLVASRLYQRKTLTKIRQSELCWGRVSPGRIGEYLKSLSAIPQGSA